MGNAKVLNNRRPQGGLPSERGGDACWKFRIKRSIRPTGVPPQRPLYVLVIVQNPPKKTQNRNAGKTGLWHVSIWASQAPYHVSTHTSASSRNCSLQSCRGSKGIANCEFLVFVFGSRLSYSSHHGCTSRSSRDLFAFCRWERFLPYYVLVLSRFVILDYDEFAPFSVDRTWKNATWRLSRVFILNPFLLV